MSQQSTMPTRTGAMIVAATAAITLAAGVTVGSLLGWVGPDRAAPAQAPAEAAPSEAPTSTPAIADGDVTFASRERPRRERGEHHERKRSHHEGHDHDD
ncbi:MAG: hypothetical protein QM820_40565 [Minicystis sp.]